MNEEESSRSFVTEDTGTEDHLPIDIEEEEDLSHNDLVYIYLEQVKQIENMKAFFAENI